jgi:Uma2 family endonuclease
MPTTMTTALSHRPITAEELFALPDDGNRYELVRGELIVMSPSALPPTVVAGNLFGRLWNFLRRHRRLGVCGFSEGGFKLESDPDTVRAPDIWFLRADRVPPGGLPRGGYWPGTPDLAVEVLSPSDRFTAVLRKAQDYLAAGTGLVWIIDPEGRSAAIFRPGQAPMLIGESGILDGGNLLPGFSVRLHDVLV